MRTRRYILALLVLALVVAAIWIFSHPKIDLVIRGSLMPQEIAAVKSVVKKDMAKRLLPDYSGASIKGLWPNLRAYFKYNIVDINSPGLGVAMVKVGDGRTVGTSKHICEYHLFHNTNGWVVGTIFSGRSLFVGNAPTLWRSPPTNRAAPDSGNSFSVSKSRLPFSTNLAAPPISLSAGSARRDLALPLFPIDSSFPALTNSYGLTLRAPSATHIVTTATPVGPGMTLPAYRGGLTNIMPLGK